MSEIGSLAPIPSRGPAVSHGALDEGTARELLRITREMVSAAHADDWDQVALHDATRRELLDRTPAATREVLPDTLTEALLAADTAVLERARRARELLVDDTHRVRTERDARNIYTRVMSGDERSAT